MVLSQSYWQGDLLVVLLDDMPVQLGRDEGGFRYNILPVPCQTLHQDFQLAGL
jgi:hypothetical protein